jgi:hypothetical protein
MEPIRIQDGTPWANGGPRRTFPSLEGDLSTDVLVVGAGVAGLTSALLLARRGRLVTVIDARQVASGETGRTTAHLTELLDVGYRRLEAKFGRQGAEAAAEASRSAIDSIETSCAELAPLARFERVPGHKAAQTDEQMEELKEELAAMQRAGIRADWTREPMPFPSLGAVRLEHQAQLEPGEYASGLLEGLLGLGVTVFENTHALDFQDGTPCRVMTERGMITAKDVLVLTNVPISNRFAIHTKVAAYRTIRAGGHLPGLSERPLRRHVEAVSLRASAADGARRLRNHRRRRPSHGARGRDGGTLRGAHAVCSLDLFGLHAAVPMVRTNHRADGRAAVHR